MSDSILTATGSKYEIQNYEVKNLNNFIRYFTFYSWEFLTASNSAKKKKSAV